MGIKLLRLINCKNEREAHRSVDERGRKMSGHRDEKKKKKMKKKKKKNEKKKHTQALSEENTETHETTHRIMRRCTAVDRELRLVYTIGTHMKRSRSNTEKKTQMMERKRNRNTHTHTRKREKKKNTKERTYKDRLFV